MKTKLLRKLVVCTLLALATAFALALTAFDCGDYVSGGSLGGAPAGAKRSEPADVSLSLGYGSGTTSIRYDYMAGKAVSATVYLTLDGITFSGKMTLNFPSEEGMDVREITVERGKKYHAVYVYYFATSWTIYETKVTISAGGGASGSVVATLNHTGTVLKGSFIIAEV